MGGVGKERQRNEMKRASSIFFCFGKIRDRAILMKTGVVLKITSFGELVICVVCTCCLFFMNLVVSF